MPLPLEKYSNSYENFCKRLKKQPHQEELIEKEKILVGFFFSLGSLIITSQLSPLRWKT